LLLLAVVLPGCALPPGRLGQTDTRVSAQALQQAERQGYARGFAAGALAQALRDKTRETAEDAPRQELPAPPAPPVAPVAAQPVVPVTPDTSLPPGTSYNSSGTAKPLGGSAVPF
jgi:hypothetical protein